MGFQLEDGIGTGNKAEVNSENRLATVSVVHELQHHISNKFGQSYQIIGEHSLASSGTKTILHIRNDDPTKNMIISYMRLQFPDNNSDSTSSTYFQLGFNTIYVSNGTEISAVNVNAASGNTALITAYENAPIVSGAITEIDRWYPDKSMMIFNKHGSVILGLNNTLEWRLITDQSSGLVYVRITIMMMDKL